MADLAPHQQHLLDRFVERARADDRLTGVALVGSHAAGTADRHSDLDLFLVTEKEKFHEFIAARDEFLGSLGEALFIGTWGDPERWFFIYGSGADGDLTVVDAETVGGVIKSPFRVLLDKRGVLAGVRAQPLSSSPGAPRTEYLERLLLAFWHDYAHCITAIGRGQLWWANGQLEALRGMCANLLRLAADPSDPEAGDEPYWKVDLTLPREQLGRLTPTLNTFDRASMLNAANAVAGLYREVGLPLAAASKVSYPAELERVMLSRLEELH